MKYILSTLDIIDKVSDELSLDYNDKDKYRSLVSKIYALEEIDNISSILRKDIIVYLKSLEIQYEKELLQKISGIDNMTFEGLSNAQLLKYLSIVLRTVTYLQKDNLLLVKYSKTIWNTGWHNLAKQSRGKVLDLETRKIVSYPFNKFFNLNEVDETKIDRISKLLDCADYISVTDKKDGSAIIVTNYNGDIIINTNGEFDNDQIKWAKQLLVDKYSYFYNNIPMGYTFIFELIHPQNRIVLDYGDEQKLYLLAIRDLKNLKLLKYNTLKKVANRFYLDITESFEFTNLDSFIEKTENETENIKEGWVFRVISKNIDMMFKLKYQEYFRLSRIKAIPSLKKIYSLVQTDKLDDVLSVAESSIKDAVMEDVKTIFEYIENFKNLILSDVSSYVSKYNIEKGNMNKESILAVLRELKGNPFTPYIMRVLKENADVNTLFEILPKVSLFGELYKYYNSRYNIELDEWDSK